MDALYNLQFASLIFMVMNAMTLALTRLHVKWVNSKYELSRWMLCMAHLLMGVQYLLQMMFGVRASGDEAGAVLNVLFYTPCFVLFAVAIYNIVALKRNLLRFVLPNVVLYSLIITICCVSYSYDGDLDMEGWLYVMIALFMLSVGHSVIIVVRELRKRWLFIEKESAVDLLPYVRYARSSVAVLLMTALIMPFSILSTKMLLFIGPWALFAVFFFLITFVSLGYGSAPKTVYIADNTETVDEIKDEEDDEDEEDRADEAGDAADAEEEVPDTLISGERVMEIRERLAEWCDNYGYRDSGVNMQSLSFSINIPKNQLSFYFDEILHNTFRVWLSDIRFKAAQEMMIAHPEYSNDVISAECGFASRSYLYRMFKERLGVTPAEWRERHCK